MTPMNDFIGSHIRRANRNLLFVNAAILLVLALTAGAFSRYLLNFFAGPRNISAQELASLSNPDGMLRNYVHVTGEKTLDTGVTEVEQTKRKYSSEVTSERTTAYFVMLKVGSKVLLVKTPEGSGKTEFTGELQAVPADIQGRTIDSVTADDPTTKDMFVPAMLDAGNYKTPGYIGLALGIPTFLLCAWNLGKALKRSGNPSSHPIMQTLGKYGDAQTVSAQLHSEVQAGAQMFGGVTLTNNWMIEQDTFGLHLWRMDDVVWAYKKVTQHRTNGIPTGKTYSAVVCDRSGSMKTVSGSETVVDNLVMYLANRLPWIAVGFDDQLQNWWNKDRAGMIAGVDQRHVQMTQVQHAPVNYAGDPNAPGYAPQPAPPVA